MIVLIPAYEPDERLIDLVEALRTADPQLGTLVVDDGSGPAFQTLFDAARARGATVLIQPANAGKGHALKRGFAHVAAHHPDADVVCADCDGQHSVFDILRVAARVRESSATMVLGARQPSGTVPLRSRVGNAVTRRAFSLATGVRLHDTQTGLRGYPASALTWLQTVPGGRYEYELNLLLEATACGLEIDEVAIATIYLDGNASSHFRPVVDSLRIYAPMLRFVASSFAAFLVDTLAVLVLHALTGSLLVSVLGARAVSATVNFVANRTVVFEQGRSRRVGSAAVRYLALAGTLLAANVAMMAVLTSTGLPLLVAKVLTEAVLVVVSYRFQRTVVFAVPAARSVAHSTARPAWTAASQVSHKQHRPPA